MQSVDLAPFPTVFGRRWLTLHYSQENNTYKNREDKNLAPTHTTTHSTPLERAFPFPEEQDAGLETFPSPHCGSL